MARKCGSCHRNIRRNSDHGAGVDSEPPAPTQPMSGGSAPGTAPTTLGRDVPRLGGGAGAAQTTVSSDVRRWSGVYTSTYVSMVVSARRAAAVVDVSQSMATP